MKKILVAVDGTKNSKKAVKKCVEMSKCYDSEVVLLYVQQFPYPVISGPELEELKRSLEISPVKDDLESRGKEMLSRVESILRKNSSIVEVKPIMKWGDPAEEILRVAEEENTEIIILSSGKTERGVFLGNPNKEVVERAKVSVMTAA
jgi:nucleotide-binding universal stress UspA family protein